MFWNWFRKDPSKALRDATTELEQVVARGAPPGPTQKALQRLADASARAEDGARSEALGRLCQAATEAPLPPSSGALFGIGLLIETGADPRPASQVILARTRDAFVRAARQVRLVEQAFDEAERRAGRQLSDDEAMAALAGLEEHPEDGEIGNLIDAFAHPLLALLPRSKSARKSMNGDDEFRRALSTFARFEDKPAGQVARFAGLLDDEELVVIHLPTLQGVKVKCAGISHNFQLHTLLADTLIPDVFPGTPPDPLVAAEARSRCIPLKELPEAKASFHLMHFGAVQPDGSINEDPFGAVVWHEGTPSDIPALDGIRVVLLGEPTLKRSWRAPRDFPAMEGEMALTARLDRAEVDTWLRRAAEAPRPPDPRKPPVDA